MKIFNVVLVALFCILVTACGSPTDSTASEENADEIVQLFGYHCYTDGEGHYQCDYWDEADELSETLEGQGQSCTEPFYVHGSPGMWEFDCTVMPIEE